MGHYFLNSLQVSANVYQIFVERIKQTYLHPEQLGTPYCIKVLDTFRIEPATTMINRPILWTKIQQIDNFSTTARQLTHTATMFVKSIKVLSFCHYYLSVSSFSVIPTLYLNVLWIKLQFFTPKIR